MATQDNPETTPEVQPETQVGDQILPIKCQAMLHNRTQCTRYATRRKPADVTGREAMCDVCIALMKDRSNAELYTEPVERPESR